MKNEITVAPGKAHRLHALVVDDSDGMRRSVVALLKPQNIRVTAAANGAEAIEWLSTASFDFVLTDLQMPEVNGLDLLEWIRANQPDIPAVLMSGTFTVAVARAALEGGAAAVLSKPFGSSELSDVLSLLFSKATALPV